jgi:hypothetical protein
MSAAMRAGEHADERASRRPCSDEQRLIGRTCDPGHVVAHSDSLSLLDLMNRLMAELFDADATFDGAERVEGSEARVWTALVRLTSRHGNGRTVTLRAWRYGVIAQFSEPDVSAALVADEDETSVLVEEGLRKLAGPVAVYLQGGGAVKTRRGLWGGRREDLLLDTADGRWRIGRRSTSMPYRDS